MLTADQRESFTAQGLVRLPAALDAQVAERMADAVWAFLAAEQGIRRKDPLTWTTPRPTGFNRLSRSGALDRLWTSAVEGVLSELFAGDEQSRERPRVLLTLPGPDSIWHVPSDGWHFDFTPLQDRPGLRAVQVFALLSDVRPKGGGTLVLSGSHHLVSRYGARTGREPRPRLVRGDLAARHPWLAELWGRRDDEAALAENRTARFLGTTVAVDGIPLSVNEVTGRAGDVYLMDSDCFHAMAPNSLDVARVMCTSLVVRSSPVR